MQALDLVITLNNDRNFEEFAAMIDALVFLLVIDVLLGMVFLRQNIHPHPRVVELLDYFDRAYVNGVPNVQAPNQPVLLRPMFPPVLWNVHTATLNDDPRTNNVCESWNNAYYHTIGHNHPSMWKSIHGLQKQNAKDEAVILQHAFGQQPRLRIIYVLLWTEDIYILLVFCIGSLCFILLFHYIYLWLRYRS